MLFEPIDLKDQKAKIIVVGVGGGGGNWGRKVNCQVKTRYGTRSITIM